jgi:hypothetical protein
MVIIALVPEVSICLNAGLRTLKELREGVKKRLLENFEGQTRV